jgi:hypothetical protein
LRQEIESVRTSADDNRFDNVDVDLLVEEYLQELVGNGEEIGEWMEESDGLEFESVTPTDWIRCPLCSRGYILMPFPGIFACDFCRDMQLCISTENFSLADLASCLDKAIISHRDSGCQAPITKFIIRDNILFQTCDTCNKVDVVL